MATCITYYVSQKSRQKLDKLNKKVEIKCAEKNYQICCKYMLKSSDMSCRELLEELNPIIKEALERRPEVS